jgi:cytochrome c553
MRKAAFWTALVVAVVFAAGTAFAAPPDKVVFKAAKAKGPVAFDHKEHGTKVKECAACHHADKAGAEQKCSKCHGDKTDGKKLSLKEAFHAQCKDCHKKDKKGPEKCDGCHKK